ncbi:hypothetical protein BKA80DRAFT_62077 [Phyllosticta citrichinensis]
MLACLLASFFLARDSLLVSRRARWKLVVSHDARKAKKDEKAEEEKEELSLFHHHRGSSSVSISTPPFFPHSPTTFFARIKWLWLLASIRAVRVVAYPEYRARRQGFWRVHPFAVRVN